MIVEFHPFAEVWFIENELFSGFYLALGAGAAVYLCRWWSLRNAEAESPTPSMLRGKMNAISFNRIKFNE